MKAIELYDWADTKKLKVIRTVPVQETENLNRNGKERIFVWTGDGQEFNYTLYPQYGTAYPEYEYRIQAQRIAERYLYSVVE